MAGRPTKQGLDYFPVDVDIFEDDKIEYVAARFDEKGELIIIKLLCSIYRNGYFTKWNDDKATIFAKRAGRNTSPSLVKDVVGELVKRGFFDGGIFNSFAVLTSRGIQKRYLRAAAERKELEITEDYWLLDIPKSTKQQHITIIHSNNPINLPNNSINLPNNSQSKVKESKEVLKDIVGTGVPTTPHDNSLSKSGKKIRKQFPKDSVEYLCSKYLVDKILENKVDAKVPRNEDELQKWCVHMDYLLRIDKRPMDELRAVIKVATTDSFWRMHILSTEKLRAKYDTLAMQLSTQISRLNKPTAIATKPNRFANFEQRVWDEEQLKKLETAYLDSSKPKQEE